MTTMKEGRKNQDDTREYTEKRRSELHEMRNLTHKLELSGCRNLSLLSAFAEVCNY